jgi:hypothetical protein
MSQAKRQFCVYASTLINAVGTTYAVGDGITAPSRRLYGLADTRQEAEAIKAKLEAGRHMTRPRIPGDEKMWPELEVDEYDPLNFVGRQNRDDYTGKRYASLCGQLAETAERNMAALLR